MRALTEKEKKEIKKLEKDRLKAAEAFRQYQRMLDQDAKLIELRERWMDLNQQIYDLRWKALGDE